MNRRHLQASRAVRAVVATLSLAAHASAEPPSTQPTPKLPPLVTQLVEPGPGERSVVVNGPAKGGINGAGFANGGAMNMLEAQRQGVAASERQYSALAVARTFAHRSELCAVAMRDGNLIVEPGAPLTDVLEGPTVGVRQTRIKVEDSPLTWVANTYAAGPLPGTRLTLMCMDFTRSGDGQIWMTQLTVSDRDLTLVANGVGRQFRYQQNANTVFLHLLEYKEGRYQQAFGYSAPTLADLQAQHPDEVRQYLGALLSKFTDADVLRPGAADVYAIFPDVPVPPDAAARAAELLPRLDAPAFATRDAATREWRSMGRAGVLAAMRVDRTTLTDEQKGRLDAIIAADRRRDVTDPQAARRDLRLMVECLEDADTTVRGEAKAAVEETLGRPVDVDVDAKPDAIATAVDALRRQVLPPPATQPATPPVPAPIGPPMRVFR